MTVRKSVGALLVAWAVVAVAPSSSLAQKKSRDLITREEILKSYQANLDVFAVIRALRPHFLAAPRGVRSLGGGGTAALAVYVDRIRQTGVDQLRQMMAASVEEIRYLDPTRSESEYGITANGGAIVVKRYKATSALDTLRRPPD